MKTLRLTPSRLWALLTCLLIVFAWSAAVGTKPVHAASCTPLQCSQGQAYANAACRGNGGVASFFCGVDDGADDFVYICGNPAVNGQFDCAHPLNPS
jgi:hypothetical protein